MRRLLLAGTDKCSINSAAVARPDLVREAAEKFGSQCVVVAVDAKQTGAGTLGGLHPWRPHAHRASTRSPGAAQVVSLGAGEILLTSMDRDGTGSGFDLDLLRAVCGAVRLPVDRLGRRRHAASISSRARRPARPACSPPACFISARSRSPQVKQALADAGLPVRLPRGGLTMASRRSANRQVAAQDVKAKTSRQGRQQDRRQARHATVPGGRAAAC